MRWPVRKSLQWLRTKFVVEMGKKKMDLRNMQEVQSLRWDSFITGMSPQSVRTQLACFRITGAFLEGQDLVVRKEGGSGVSGSHAEGALNAPLDTRVGNSEKRHA